MTDWSAVVWGFVTIVVGGLLATALPGVGHLAAGIVGGAVAGYLAGGGVLSGTWHGLLAGMLGGVVVAVLFGVLVTLVASVGLGPFGALAGGAVLVGGLAIAFVTAVDSALGGAVGGLLG